VGVASEKTSNGRARRVSTPPGEKAPTAPSAPSRQGRRRRCTRARHVRIAVLRVTDDLRAGHIDANTANALANCYRLILTTIVGVEDQRRLEQLEERAARAAELAGGALS
jgi:hypothetical protein